PRSLFRQTKVGLDVEKIVLNAGKRSIERLVAGRVQSHQADNGIDFVQGAIGFNAKVVLLAPRARSKGRRAVVTCPGIDTVEHDHTDLPKPFSLPRIRGSLILSGFKKWGTTHAYSDDCPFRRIPRLAICRACARLRSRPSRQSRRHRLLRYKKEKGKKIERESGVYARGTDEVRL